MLADFSTNALTENKVQVADSQLKVTETIFENEFDSCMYRNKSEIKNAGIVMVYG